MLGCKLSNQPTAVPLVPRLSVLSIDPNRAVDAYRARVLAQIPHASAQERASVEEEMSGSCTIEVAVFDEFSSLLAGDDVVGVQVEASPAAATSSSCCPPPAAAKSSSCCPPPAAAKASSCCPPPDAAKASSCCPPPAAATSSSCCPSPAAAKSSSCCPPPAAAKSASCCPAPPTVSAAPQPAPAPAHAHFDHIVFDTAPSGHTLKLLSLPRAWASFLTGNDRGAACLGPHSGMSMQRTRFERAVSALTDAAQTLLVLVARPEKTALAEASHTSVELKGIGLRRQHLIVNGVFRAADRSDTIAAAFEDTGRACIEAMSNELKALPCDEVSLRSFDTNSVAALRALLASDDVKIELPQAMSASASDAVHAPRLQALIDELAVSSHGLVMVMGKGGVGKTTVAVALAASLAARGLRVHLGTTDPSSHLLATLDGGQLPGLVVSHIDPAEEKRRYIDRVMATRGATLDDAGRALLAEDLRSPCTEDVAVFEAFSRVVESSAADLVVLDTAPTGHSLLLIDAADAYQRQSVREGGSSSQAAEEAPAPIVSPLARLRDATHTRVLMVTTPEPTPVSQAAALQADLLRAGIRAYGWILNRSLAATDTKDPLLLARLRSECVQYQRATKLSQRLYVMPFSPMPPVGLDALARLAAPTKAPAHKSE